MRQELNMVLDPSEAYNEEILKKIIAQKFAVDESEIMIRIIRRSIDARHPNIKVNLSLEVFIDETPASRIGEFRYQDVFSKKEVIIVGSGPAGLFAALKLIETGFRPIILERGKDVANRKKDVAGISRDHLVNPDSNYCFGEGGAGIFSDGKLYTRSKKRGNTRRILEIFFHHGADESILFESHPHIGTDKLPDVIKNIRNTILNCGGKIFFNSLVTDLIIENEQVKGVVTREGEKYFSDAVILATGHSARDIYFMLKRKKIFLQAKDFAMGVRVEHEQNLINSIQYHGAKYNKMMPAASYTLAEQIFGRGVFSFCMCPGGFIVPSATSQDEIVVNGMSTSKRNSPYANSGIVVEVKQQDVYEYSDYEELAGLMFQQNLERNAFNQSSKDQKAPAQRLSDFLNGKISASLPKSSYFPGTTSSPIHSWLPGFMVKSLQFGFIAFDKKMKGFINNDVIILGVESRTSSPVRIPRNPETLQHIQIKGLYPCGEGSGYAGGIVSSAIDGENCAEKIRLVI